MRTFLEVTLCGFVVSLLVAMIAGLMLCLVESDREHLNTETCFIIQSIKETGEGKYMYRISSPSDIPGVVNETFNYITSESLGMPGDTVKITSL